MVHPDASVQPIQSMLSNIAQDEGTERNNPKFRRVSGTVSCDTTAGLRLSCCSYRPRGSSIFEYFMNSPSKGGESIGAAYLMVKGKD